MKRRTFIQGIGIAAITFPAWAENRKTPSQQEGPFYPVKEIPVRESLILNADSLVGESMNLQGKVFDTNGKALAGIKVEIWQCDGVGLYDHPRQNDTEKFDPAFGGFGAAITDAEGNYQFQTLYPVPYTGRPPHIHVKLWNGNKELLTTQLYLEGQTGGGWFSRERERLQISPQPSGDTKLASFNFVV
ncbi:Protocatechuate 3,4-dioxygenase beta chain [Grimontia celer]|uniref:Protocatechuate 3,4-dioxygenase beta chain n=1 Tax=Grimontia celer TaxID=1796497 RepID=A0A128EWQ5_9GAMM|nr:protocatechuate 3,4-dioxygenase [Grimontia celer]CZF79032.1 Protocatechuate 3,4-dioxygenase beta chain [Grimontia celer]